MRIAYTLFAVLLTLSVSGGTITSLHPSSIPLRSGEHFLTVNGSGLGNRLVFDGPAGHFELDVNATYAGSVVCWIPQEVVNNNGDYMVTSIGDGGESNAAVFTVSKGIRFPLKLHLPESLLALAKTRLATTVDYEITASGGDPATTRISCDPKSGSDFPFGSSWITCTAEDGNGEKDDGRIQINVWDGTAPTLWIPKSFEVPADDQEGAYVKYEASAFDEIDGDLRVICAPESGSIFRPGRTTVNCEATDLSLNPAYEQFEVFVQPKDIGTLALRVPDRVVEAAQNEEGATVAFEAIAYGSADPDPVVTCNPPSESFFFLGETKVECMAEDDFGQRADAAFVVEVVEKLGLRMADVSAEASSTSGTEVTWEPAAEEWSAEISCSPAPGSLFALGSTSVECESTDERGRRAAGVFQVNVRDSIAPHIGRVRAAVGRAEAEGGYIPVRVEVEAADAGDAMPRCTIASLTAEGTPVDWSVRSDLEVAVRADFARPFRIQVSCVDASGNRATDSVAVSLVRSGKTRPIAN